MKTFPLLVLASCLGALVSAAAACGEDTATVRPRLDGGGGDGASSDGSNGGPGALACGAPVPATYDSPAFAQNAAVELALAQRLLELGDKLRSTEGESTDVVTANDLRATYSAGAPSLRAVSTSEAQALADGYFADVEAAMGETWTPALPDQDSGTSTGGKYGDFHVDRVGLDLRAATESSLLGGALYNHVLGLVAAPISEVTVDKLLAAFGASTTFQHRPGPDAGADADQLIAAHAARLDDPSSSTPGPYRKIQTALLRTRAAVQGGESCKADLDEAVASFLAEWERTTFASAISRLAAAASSAADPTAGPTTLHAFGEAIGLIQGFRGLGKRRITDAQIDTLLAKVGAATPYKLVTSPGDTSLKLNEAINDIALYEGFTPDEIAAFRQPR